MQQQTDYFVSNYYRNLTGNHTKDDNLIPTPPLSPSLHFDSSHLDPALSMLVHPDRVLSQHQKPKYQDLNPVISYPVIAKEENFGDVTQFSDDDCDFSYDHYFDDNKLEGSKCFDSADWWNDSRIFDSLNVTTNDTQSSSNNATSAKFAPESDLSRTRLYSVGAYDPYSSESVPLFDGIELNLDYIHCRPDTPDESTDAATCYEIQRRSIHVLLEHNYNFPASKKPPTPKKQHSRAKTGSDDEVDVVTYEEKNKNVLNRVCRFNNISSPEEIMNFENFPDVGATVTIAPAKPRRGRCTITPIPKKVGRPPKATKRLQPTKASSAVKDTVVQKTNCRGVIMDPEKRFLHNSLERERRITLRESFDRVRMRVPSLIDKPKAPKVLILTSASSYITSMTAEVNRRVNEIERLTLIRNLLRNQLRSLEPNLSP